MGASPWVGWWVLAPGWVGASSWVVEWVLALGWVAAHPWVGGCLPLGGWLPAPGWGLEVLASLRNAMGVTLTPGDKLRAVV